MNLRGGQLVRQRVAGKEAGLFFQYVSGGEQHCTITPEDRDVSGKPCRWLGGRSDV